MSREHDASEEIESGPACKEEDGLVRFGLSMPAPLVRELDAWRKVRGYTNRSEAVRDLVRDALVEAQWEQAQADPGAEMVGVVTLVYDHTTRQLSDHLIDMQHHAHGVAQATLHIHLTPEHCLEVIVLRGSRADVTGMADHLISARGVLHGKFVPTTSGDKIG
jgi:CopG family nickel-responsive transcriptional regulator